ncbi:MAG TPA: class I SAM-dependent methyltransferase [Trebonia sp.]
MLAAAVPATAGTAPGNEGPAGRSAALAERPRRRAAGRDVFGDLGRLCRGALRAEFLRARQRQDRRADLRRRTGTGCGVGLAWMFDAAGESASIVSVELDPGRAAASAALFAKQPNVRVLHGNWAELRDHGPFDLLVLDGGGKGKEPEDDPPLDPAEGWLAVGGTIVLDDFIPFDRPGAPAHDHAHRYWLGHPALQATELRLSPTLATLVGVRPR